MTKLSPRQQLYKKNRLLGMTQKNAAVAAGYSEKYAAQACRIERILKVSLRDEFERKGLTDKKIAEFALDGMSATKDGVNPDWPIRHKFFETTMKLAGIVEERPLIDASQHTTYIWESDKNQLPAPRLSVGELERSA